MYVGDNMGVGEILSYATGLKRSHFVQYHFISFVSILKLTVNFNVWVYILSMDQRVWGREFKYFGC